jgi:cytochrome P450
MSNNSITNTPGVSRAEAFLRSKDLLNNPIEVFEGYRKSMGPNFTFFFGGAKRTIITADPDFIQYILKDNNSNYLKSDIQVKRMAEFQGVGLLNSHGDYWLRQRRLLSMGFTRSNLSSILPTQIDMLAGFMDSFDKSIDEGPVDIYSQMVKFTLKSVGKTLFGDDMDDDELEQIGEAISEIQEFILQQVFKPYLIPWYRVSGKTASFQKTRAKADKLVIDYINERKKTGSKNWDFLKLVLETPYKDTGDLMSDEQIKIEILQLLVAGNETSSNALTWSFYLLAKNPEHIVKIREEINEVFGDEDVDYNSLHSLEHTMNVLNEVLRIYPPFWMIDRIAIKDDEFNGIKIPSGSILVPYIYGVHHNSECWESPSEFKPSRFTKENKNNHHPFAHVPFGGGPRVCIGQNMAVMQILLVLVSVIKKYDFKIINNVTVEMDPRMILRPKGDVMLDFSRIKVD